MIDNLGQQSLRLQAFNLDPGNVRRLDILVRLQYRIADHRLVGLGDLIRVNAYDCCVKDDIRDIHVRRARHRNVAHLCLSAFNICATNRDLASLVVELSVIRGQKRVVADHLLLERHSPSVALALPTAHVPARELHVLVLLGNVRHK